MIIHFQTKLVKLFILEMVKEKIREYTLRQKGAEGCNLTPIIFRFSIIRKKLTHVLQFFSVSMCWASVILRIFY